MDQDGLLGCSRPLNSQPNWPWISQRSKVTNLGEDPSIQHTSNLRKQHSSYNMYQPSLDHPSSWCPSNLVHAKLQVVCQLVAPHWCEAPSGVQCSKQGLEWNVMMPKRSWTLTWRDQGLFGASGHDIMDCVFLFFLGVSAWRQGEAPDLDTSGASRKCGSTATGREAKW